MTRYSDKPKVGIFIPQLALGGAEMQVVALARLLHEAGEFDPRVITVEDYDDVCRTLRDSGVVVLQLRRSSWHGLEVVRALAAVIRSEKINIVHAFTWPANWRAALVKVAFPTIPVIASIRGMENNLSRRHMIAYRVLSPLLTFVTANAEAIIHQSSRRTRIPVKKYRLIRNAVLPERMVDASLSPIARDRRGTLTIGFVGRLEPRKDVGFLAEVAGEVLQMQKNVIFSVIGGGEEEERLRREIFAKGLEQSFEFVGKKRDLREAFLRLDVLVNTSTEEGCSNAILEAMGSGIPVVATAVGGTPEIVKDGVTGYLVARGEARVFARRVVSLLRDPELRRNMGSAGRKMVGELYSPQASLEAVQALYRDALDYRRPDEVVDG